MGYQKVKRYDGNKNRGINPRISLRKSIGIGINTAACDDYIPDDIEYAHVFYNIEAKKIGIKPLEEHEADAYKMSWNGEKRDAAINPFGFLKAYNLVPEVTTRYEVHWDHDEQMLVADLTKPESTHGEGEPFIPEHSDDPASSEGEPVAVEN